MGRKCLTFALVLVFVTSFAHSERSVVAMFSSKQDYLLFMENSKTSLLQIYIECADTSENLTVTLEIENQEVAYVTSSKLETVLCSNASYTNETFMPMGSTPGYEAVENTSLIQTEEKLMLRHQIRLEMYAVMIGKTTLFVKIASGHHDNLTSLGDAEISAAEVKLIILRTATVLDSIFRVIITTFLVTVTLGFGCKLELDVVKKAIKRPVAVSIGLGCQYVFMPLTAYAIARLVTQHDYTTSLGIFLAGCCPGGGASNIYSHLLDGDLSLSITMTMISTIAALGLLPFWLYTLGQHFLQQESSSKVNIPFMNIFTTLLYLILPLLLGIFIKAKLPKVKRFILKVITPFTVVAIVFLLTVGIYTNLYIFKLFRPLVILAGCLLPYIGYVLGGLTALVLRQSKKKIITIAIETGMQNVGIAMILLLYTFPPPDGMLAAVVPAASAVMTPLPLFVITIIYLVYKKCNPEKFRKERQLEEKLNDLDVDVNVDTADDRKHDINENGFKTESLPLTLDDDMRETDI